MTWKFELVAGPYQGPTGGLAWDGAAMLFSAVSEERILRFDPNTGAVTDFRRYTGRTNGIALGPDGSLISPSGAVLETQSVPSDLPIKCGFGDADLGSLYVTTGVGHLYCAKATGRHGFRRPR